MVQAVIWPRCSGGLVSLPEASSHTATTLPAGEPKVARTWAAPVPSHRARAGEDQQRPSFRLPGGVAAGVKSGVHRNPVRVAAAAPAAARQRLVIAGNLVGAFSGLVLMIWCLAGCR